jgi:hypothetical protein
MRARELRVYESFRRIRVFITGLRSTDTRAFRLALGALNREIDMLARHAVTQEWAPATTREEVARQKDLVDRLLREHMAPLVTTARAQMDPSSDVALRSAFRMPRGGVSVHRALLLSDTMMRIAEPFSDLFIAEGLPRDWLARFEAARSALEATTVRRAGTVVARSTATQGVATALRRGRLAVNRLDALMRSAHRRDEGILKAWRGAKRVHAG